ncbi:hypothetical protein AO262_19465 [Pseudomonas fluorescens ABAC62]|nr:hypothetical protein AO262_19465 [Pseudomonas fluorescens ABAC62]
MELHYVWIGLAAILVLAELWAINVVLRSTSGWETKGLWLVILIFVPLFGLIAWVMFGPKREMPEHRKS